MYIDSKGYWSYSAGPNRNKRVHTVLMEKHLGRKLKKSEQVHHRDENKLNNEEHWDGKWNLELMDVVKHGAVSAAQHWFLRTFIWPREKQEWDEYHANVLAPPRILKARLTDATRSSESDSMSLCAVPQLWSA
jgi:hypothetical protein